MFAGLPKVRETLLQNCSLIVATSDSSNSETIEKGWVHNANLMTCKKSFFYILKGQSWYVITHSKGVFMKVTSKINKIRGLQARLKASDGHI